MKPQSNLPDGNEWKLLASGMSSTAVPSAVQSFMKTFVTEIINPILEVVFALALAYFLWGLMVFIFKDADPAKHKEGRAHMLWGIVGMTVMVSVYSLIWLALNTFGVSSSGLPSNGFI